MIIGARTIAIAVKTAVRRTTWPGANTRLDADEELMPYEYTLSFHPQPPHLSLLPEVTVEHDRHSASSNFLTGLVAPQWQSNVPGFSGQSMSVMPIKGFFLALQFVAHSSRLVADKTSESKKLPGWLPPSIPPEVHGKRT